MLANGVSSWGNAGLDPSSTAVTFAYAQSVAPPSDPANTASRFSIHNTRGRWTHDLNSAKIANFAELVQSLSEAPES